MPDPRALVCAALVVLLPLAPAGAAPPAPAAFSACAACHTGRPDALGPDLAGVVGRKAGSAPGFRYSGPMKRSAVVWDKDTLVRYLEDPQAVVPGNRMPMNGISPDAAEQVAEYLGQLH